MESSSHDLFQLRAPKSQVHVLYVQDQNVTKRMSTGPLAGLHLHNHLFYVQSLLSEFRA